ncbi:MAG: hypothetical protein NTX00_03030 [Candidatus Parcubacteria bacterium]|nr:hypothetical protein [Candidatus Parcubacteria bacterium]
MAKQLTKQEIQKKSKKIERIYKDYLAKLKILQQKQNQIINDFIKEIEERKIREIRNKL